MALQAMPVVVAAVAYVSNKGGAQYILPNVQLHITQGI